MNNNFIDLLGKICLVTQCVSGRRDRRYVKLFYITCILARDKRGSTLASLTASLNESSFYQTQCIQHSTIYIILHLLYRV